MVGIPMVVMINAHLRMGGQTENQITLAGLWKKAAVVLKETNFLVWKSVLVDNVLIEEQVWLDAYHGVTEIRVPNSL